MSVIPIFYLKLLPLRAEIDKMQADEAAGANEDEEDKEDLIDKN